MVTHDIFYQEVQRLLPVVFAICSQLFDLELRDDQWFDMLARILATSEQLVLGFLPMM